MQNTKRGSAAVLSRYCPEPLTAEHMSHLATIIADHGGQLNDVFCHGMPNPEWLQASVDVGRGDYLRLSEALLETDAFRVRVLKGFPYGIPVIDRFRLDLELSAGI